MDHKERGRAIDANLRNLLQRVDDQLELDKNKPLTGSPSARSVGSAGSTEAGARGSPPIGGFAAYTGQSPGREIEVDLRRMIEDSLSQSPAARGGSLASSWDSSRVSNLKDTDSPAVSSRTSPSMVSPQGTYRSANSRSLTPVMAQPVVVKREESPKFPENFYQIKNTAVGGSTFRNRGSMSLPQAHRETDRFNMQEKARLRRDQEARDKAARDKALAAQKAQQELEQSEREKMESKERILKAYNTRIAREQATQAAAQEAAQAQAAAQEREAEDQAARERESQEQEARERVEQAARERMQAEAGKSLMRANLVRTARERVEQAAREQAVLSLQEREKAARERTAREQAAQVRAAQVRAAAQEEREGRIRNMQIIHQQELAAEEVHIRNMHMAHEQQLAEQERERERALGNQADISGRRTRIFDEGCNGNWRYECFSINTGSEQTIDVPEAYRVRDSCEPADVEGIETHI